MKRPKPEPRSVAWPDDSGASSVDLLPRLASALIEAAEIYNQGVRRKVQVACPSDGRPDRLELTIDQTGFRFENSGQGRVRVLVIGTGEAQEWAQVEAIKDGAGRVVGWQEQTLQVQSQPKTRSLDALTENYMLHVVRLRLSKLENTEGT